jgi:hypothetical protein
MTNEMRDTDQICEDMVYIMGYLEGVGMGITSDDLIKLKGLIRESVNKMRELEKDISKFYEAI